MSYRPMSTNSACSFVQKADNTDFIILNMRDTRHLQIIKHCKSCLQNAILSADCLNICFMYFLVG